MPQTDALRRFLLPALLVLLLAVWLGGGVTQDDTSIDEWLQLLALPLLAVAAMVLVAEFPDDRYRRAGLAVALLIAAIPLVQLLPVPGAAWNLPPARDALAVDLGQAGVAAFPKRWTLAPLASESALWSLMPALAAFFAAMALEVGHRRRLVQAIVLLVLFNVAFAFFQTGLPQGSQLRLYQDFDAGFGGLLVNMNHQATACIIGMVLSVGLAVEAQGRVERGETRPHMPWWYAGLAGCLLLMVPLSTARAGMPIAFAALAAILLLTGVLRPSRIGRSKRATALAVGLTVAAIVGVRAAIGWVAVDEAEELRLTMRVASVAAGEAQAPLGSGVGSFIQVFEQAAPPSLQLARYVNHAHNEYAQWWLEAGWLGMLVLALSLVLLAFCGWRIASLRIRNGHAALAAGGFVAVCAVLAHSWADFPLRTTTLMTTTAALAGLMLATLQDARSREKSRRQMRHELARAARLAHDPALD
jgi:O-antigen ligase